MSTFISVFEASDHGPRVAVKDNVDVAGVVTTAGSRALADTAPAASRDAACLEGIRAGGATLVGKTNMDELAMSALGTNPWFGTPTNPLDAALIPGGSSSGSAVAVAAGLADVAIGTDTSGSIRIPAACCGVCGLKPTHDFVPTEGVRPLAPSLDVVGPLARDAAGLELGMALLVPGFRMAERPAVRVGRLRTNGQRAVEDAVDGALRRAGFDVIPVDLDWAGGDDASTTTFFCEVEQTHAKLVARYPDLVSDSIRRIIARAARYRPLADEAAQRRARWRRQLSAVFRDVELLALPTLPMAVPTVAAAQRDHSLGVAVLGLTNAFNAAGTPCSAQPIPVAAERVPASLQLVAPWGREDLLVRTVAEVERRNDDPTRK